MANKKANKDETYMKMISEGLAEFDKATEYPGPAKDIVHFDGKGPLKISTELVKTANVLERMYKTEQDEIAAGQGPAPEFYEDVKKREVSINKMTDQKDGTNDQIIPEPDPDQGETLVEQLFMEDEVPETVGKAPEEGEGEPEEKAPEGEEPAEIKDLEKEATEETPVSDEVVPPAPEGEEPETPVGAPEGEVEKGEDEEDILEVEPEEDDEDKELEEMLKEAETAAGSEQDHEGQLADGVAPVSGEVDEPEGIKENVEMGKPAALKPEGPTPPKIEKEDMDELANPDEVAKPEETEEIPVDEEPEPEEKPEEEKPVAPESPISAECLKESLSYLFEEEDETKKDEPETEEEKKEEEEKGEEGEEEKLQESINALFEDEDETLPAGDPGEHGDEKVSDLPEAAEKPETPPAGSLPSNVKKETTDEVKKKINYEGKKESIQARTAVEESAIQRLIRELDSSSIVNESDTSDIFDLIDED
jgi:hypothetical protein